jgi:hypothetical protein
MTDKPLRATAVEIVRHLQTAGFSAFWVGGCVRDFLLGREPQDYDIATDARPEQVEKLFKRTIAVGKKFGVMVVVEGGQQFQVATFAPRRITAMAGIRRRSRFRRRRGRCAAPRFHRERTFLRSAHGKNPRLGRRRKGFARENHPHHRRAGGTVCRGPFAAAARGAVCRATGF